MPLQLAPSTQPVEPLSISLTGSHWEMNHENQEGKISPPCQGVIYAVTSPRREDCTQAWVGLWGWQRAAWPSGAPVSGFFYFWPQLPGLLAQTLELS